VTLIIGFLAQALGIAVQVDWQLGRMAVSLKQTILVALNTRH
jgi:hypothetical protein